MLELPPILREKQSISTIFKPKYPYYFLYSLPNISSSKNIANSFLLTIASFIFHLSLPSLSLPAGVIKDSSPTFILLKVLIIPLRSDSDVLVESRSEEHTSELQSHVN